MRPIAILVSLAFSVPAIWAELAPKGIESGLYLRVGAVESDDIASIQPEQIHGYETSPDGTKFTVLHIRKSGAAAVRVRFANIRLPEGAALLAYGANPGQVWVYAGSDDAPILPGANVYVEIQCGNECPADLPFDIAEVSAADATDVELVPAATALESAAGTQARPSSTGGDYTIRDGFALLEGDIILGPADDVGAVEQGKDRAKNAVGITFLSGRWPGGRIPYSIDWNVPDQGRITAAANHWNTMLGGAIQIVPRTNESVYLRIIRGTGCSSYVGKVWQNVMSVSDGCGTGSLIHEFGHTVGLYHEQTREDRDKYVRVRTENIMTSAVGDFLQRLNTADDIGTYDFNSIMHYSAYAFSTNGQMTIETIPAGIPIGQRNGLSAGDIAAVRKMYGYAYTAPAPAPVTAPAPTPAPQLPAATVAVTIAANPATEQIVVDGVISTGSVTVQWVVGSTHTISAVSRTANGVAVTFAKWSDGGAATHTATASTSTTYIAAHYAVSYSVSATSAAPAYGTVSIAPASATGYYPANTSLTLKATPVSGYCFTGWTGLISGTPAATTLAVTKPYSVTAQFALGGFTLNQQLAYVSGAAGTHSVGVTTSVAGCPWTAQSPTPWIHMASTSGAGSASLSYTVDANSTGFTRVGVIVVGGRTLYVIQYA